MPTINLLNQSSPEKSVDQNSANLINMYMMVDQNQGKYQTYALPTPGLTVFSTLLSPVRALFTEHGVTYAVGANKLYSIDSGGISTILGTLNTSTGFCKIQGISDELYIIDNSNGYCYKISTNTFSTIASNTYISSIVVTAAGTGYSNPTITINDATGTGATATAVLVGGQVSSINITANGTGYSNAPTVSITDVSGTGATANAYVTTSTYPTSVIDIACQDEFGLAIQGTSQVWNCSDISDLKTWPALSFASTTGNQNYLAAIGTLYRYIWLFGTQTSEIWYNAGNLNFTFARRQDMFVEWGCAAKSSVALGNNTLNLLAQSLTGGVVLANIQNYNVVKISNSAIDYQISTYSTVSDCVGFCYMQEGHEFYVATFPTAGVTWVFDFTTQQWHQRKSSSSRWLPNCYTYNYGKQLVGDYNSGNVYYLDATNYTENGAAITRTIVTHPYYQDGQQLYCDKLQIDFDQTPGAALSNINLYVSRDGGNTFGTAKPATPVQTSDGQWRCYWNRLGKARNWVFKIETSMNNKFIVLGAWANFRSGGN